MYLYLANNLNIPLEYTNEIYHWYKRIFSILFQKGQTPFLPISFLPLSDIPLAITPPQPLSDFMRIWSMEVCPNSCPFFLRTLYGVIAKKELLEQKWMLLLHLLHWLEADTRCLCIIVVASRSQKIKHTCSCSNM